MRRRQPQPARPTSWFRLFRPPAAPAEQPRTYDHCCSGTTEDFLTAPSEITGTCRNVRFFGPMQTSQWTLLVSGLIFVASIWFVLGCARTPAAEGTAAAPVASVRELMTGLVSPAATNIYRSVGYVV